MEHGTCGVCGRKIPLSQGTKFDGLLFCDPCLEQETTTCVQCGTRIWNDENSGDSHTPLCASCYERYYISCARCGEIIHYDDACYNAPDEDVPLCMSCSTRRQENHQIHDYYYKPIPIFYGNGPRYFGVELEIDGAGEVNTNAERICDIAECNGAEYLYCKHDGSLEEGFELVTHPMSLPYHLNNMPWAQILRSAASMGYLSHQADTCGLHIHVNRTAFGETERKQDACIARILYFFEKHWEELLKFSRRSQYQLDRWAARYGYKDRPQDILEHAKKGAHASRYTCVNLTNSQTVEFRIFRGTLKYNTLIATLQLVDRVCDVALFLSDEEIKAMSWTTFVSGCTQPELVQYLKERRLYVNEPVEVEVEI